MSKVPLKEQYLIIDAICYAYDHYADYFVYVKNALEKEKIEYNSSHEVFVEEYLTESGIW